MSAALLNAVRVAPAALTWKKENGRTGVRPFRFGDGDRRRGGRSCVGDYQ